MTEIPFFMKAGRGATAEQLQCEVLLLYILNVLRPNPVWNHTPPPHTGPGARFFQEGLC